MDDNDACLAELVERVSELERRLVEVEEALRAQPPMRARRPAPTAVKDVFVLESDLW